MKKLTFLLLGVAVLVLLAMSVPAGAANFPELIPLPTGFEPEGVVTGRGPIIYAGSLVDGSIYQADLRTGEGEILVDPPEGRVAVGLSYDARSNFIFVAGGGTGEAYVYNAATGETEGVFTLTDPGTFVNDVIVTREAAYLTDSFRPFIYRIPLGPGGSLPDPSAVEEIMLTGEFDFIPGAFNANGIEATPNGRYLIIVNSATGTLYQVDPETGEALEIDLGGDSVPNGDGLLLLGRTLYVVQNMLNQIAVVELSGMSGEITGEITGVITDDDFDVPTTVTWFGPYLYAVNARFGTPIPPGGLEYDIVQVPR